MMRFAGTLLIILTLLAACAQDKKSVAGKYVARGPASEIVLTLNKDGKGTWSTDTDEIPFKWSLRGDGKLWLHTKTGGVLQGTVEDGTIRLDLPGIRDLTFNSQ
ncbi:hypothetical protein [Pseudodesulfovibrio portus]|uniref:Uncharacterized protein n=1 Tax=Pseudodesulfovibrio portus TaxID=231439 RepID=A0ABM8AU32_9BACT|nr:hypothetical protein [Pseudodesulfovibrio portus]BDQ34993.1 hypothetical protein JCM14722_25350 [Pseudodesulfovibrio portus]